MLSGEKSKLQKGKNSMKVFYKVQDMKLKIHMNEQTQCGMKEK